MRIFVILAVLLVSFCVCTDAFFTIIVIMELMKDFKKGRFEEANRNGNGIVKDKGINI